MYLHQNLHILKMQFDLGQSEPTYYLDQFTIFEFNLGLKFEWCAIFGTIMLFRNFKVILPFSDLG